MASKSGLFASQALWDPWGSGSGFSCVYAGFLSDMHDSLPLNKRRKKSLMNGTLPDTRIYSFIAVAYKVHYKLKERILFYLNLLLFLQKF